MFNDLEAYIPYFGMVGARKGERGLLFGNMDIYTFTSITLIPKEIVV